jgi:hypothetical protein
MAFLTGEIRAGARITGALVIACAACGPSDIEGPPDLLPQEDHCSDEAPPEGGKETVILGRSEGEAFVPMAPGAALPILFGPQGGQHVYVSVKFYGLIHGRWEHRFEVIDGPTGLQAGGSLASVEACTPSWTISHNIPVYLDHHKIVEGTLKLVTSVSPELGTTALVADMPVTFSQ